MLNRFLARTMIRVVTGDDGKDLGHALTTSRIESRVEPVPKNVQGEVVRHLRPTLRKLAGFAEDLAKPQLTEEIQAARGRALAHFERELARLRHLARVNSKVSPKETEAVELTRDAVIEHLSQGQLRLDAVRVLVTT